MENQVLLTKCLILQAGEYKDIELLQGHVALVIQRGTGITKPSFLERKENSLL